VQTICNKVLQQQKKQFMRCNHVRM